MAIILDADVIIRAEKGGLDFDRWAASLPNEKFEMAAITVAELWHGVERASGVQRTRREQFLQSIVGRLPVIPYSQETALLHARIWAQLESSGKMISPYDLIVAATAIERGDSVATFNQRHFSAIPGLTVITPE